MRTFQFADQRLASTDRRIAEATATAHHNGQRPRCLCVEDGVPMYVARLGTGFLLKRMPGTGPLHAKGCPSQALPIPPTGPASAASRNSETQTTALRLGFSLRRRGLQTSGSVPSRGRAHDVPKGGGFTLAALLHYLWNEAELDRWHPSFEGRRSWGTVRKRLLGASAGKTVGNRQLRELLYIPEVFKVERCDEIRRRRSTTWQYCRRSVNGASGLMLLIGELKELTRCGDGARAVIKHIPDLRFWVSNPARLFELVTTESPRVERFPEPHLVLIGTFSIDAHGRPTIEQLHVVPMSGRWIPTHHKSLDAERLSGLHQFRGATSLRSDLDPASAYITAGVADLPTGR